MFFFKTPAFLELKQDEQAVFFGKVKFEHRTYSYVRKIAVVAAAVYSVVV